MRIVGIDFNPGSGANERVRRLSQLITPPSQIRR